MDIDMDISKHNLQQRGGGANTLHKKMRKRRELDALVTSNGTSGGAGGKRHTIPGNGPMRPSSSHDQLLSDSTDEQQEIFSRPFAAVNSSKRTNSRQCHKRCDWMFNVCTLGMIFGCIMVTSALLWLFIDIREQTSYLHVRIDNVAAGSQANPDILEKCRSATKDLEKKQNDLNSSLNSLASKLDKFSNQLLAINQKLKTSIEDDKVNITAFDLTTFDSQMKDFNLTLMQCIDSSLIMNDNYAALKHNVTDIEDRLHIVELFSIPSKRNNISLPEIYDVIANLTLDFEQMNETFSNKLIGIHQSKENDSALLESLKRANQNISTELSVLEDRLYQVMDNITKLTNNSLMSETKVTTSQEKREKRSVYQMLFGERP